MTESSQRGFTCECPADWTGLYCDVPYPKVACGESEISVQIDKRLVTEHGLDESQQRVTFSDSSDDNCHAVSDGDNYRLTIKSPFNACGTTTSRQDNDDYTFANKVVWKKIYAGQEGEADIAREITLLDFRCEYEDEYLMHLAPLKPAEATVDQETSKGDFRVNMALFRDRTFAEDRRMSSNPIVAIDDEVCVQMNLVNTLGIDNLVLSVKDCWAASGEAVAQKDKHFLIEQKCEAENEYSVDVIYNGIGDRTQFCFHMFKWNDAMDSVYLQCEVNVCDSSITHKGISQCQCPPQGFDLNTWIYPNYYNSMYNDYYTNGAGMYGDDAGEMRYYYYDYSAPAEYPEEGEQKKRKRRAVVESKKFEISKDDEGNLIIPDHIKKAPEEDIINIGYGPIHLAPKHQAGGKSHLADITIYNVTDEGPWFESPSDESKNIVLIAVGVALLLAMVVLGMVIGAYVQCRKKWDRRRQKLRELNKVREFYQGVLKPYHNPHGHLPNGDSTSNTNTSSSEKTSEPAFIRTSD